MVKGKRLKKIYKDSVIKLQQEPSLEQRLHLYNNSLFRFQFAKETWLLSPIQMQVPGFAQLMIGSEFVLTRCKCRIQTAIFLKMVPTTKSHTLGKRNYHATSQFTHNSCVANSYHALRENYQSQTKWHSLISYAGHTSQHVYTSSSLSVGTILGVSYRLKKCACLR